MTACCWSRARRCSELRGVDRVLRPELQVEYVARDLARLTSPQIHDHLAQLRLVAPRRTASFVRG